MKKIGIIGGTFNPIHNGHLLVANTVLNKLHLNQIMFIPNHAPVSIEHKQVNVSGKDRLKMTQLAVSDNPKFTVSNVELKRNQPSYMFNTIQELSQRYKDVQWYLILGADEINLLTKWYKINQLNRLVNIVSVDRNNHFGKTPYPTIKVHVPTFAISSTLIRKQIRNHQSIRYEVPKKVIQYAEKYQLY